MVMIGLYVTWLPKLASGPLWSRMALEKERCLTSWWANILYINNYVNTDSIVSILFQNIKNNDIVQDWMFRPIKNPNIVFHIWTKSFGSFERTSLVRRSSNQNIFLNQPNSVNKTILVHFRKALTSD